MISRKPDIDIQKDGRVILRGNAYRKMKEKLRAMAGHRCELCGELCANGDVHHLGSGRGLGGGKRDDRIFVDGTRNVLYACRECHSGKHIPAKVVPAKPTEDEFNEILGL
jgi:nucleoside-diphosphate-sugar epimerase